MNELLKAMSSDMHILPYQGESGLSFAYRVLFSALGQWCLRSASAPDSPISKHAQTILLKELIERYFELFPGIEESLSSEDQSVSEFIRRVYEETGYLITDKNNRNHIANAGKGICIGDNSLLLGISDTAKVMGLGVYANSVQQPISVSELLIRDCLQWQQYIDNQFNIVLFKKRDIPIDELQFFDPLSNASPSSSWSSQMKTEKTVARKSQNGPYYKVMTYENELLYCEEPPNADSDELISYEYRRLYFALKKSYGNPLGAVFKKKDDNYYEITIKGHLPNREYYLLLLCAWPKQNFTNKYQFIAHAEVVPLIKELLTNLAIEIEGD